MERIPLWHAIEGSEAAHMYYGTCRNKSYLDNLKICRQCYYVVQMREHGGRTCMWSAKECGRALE